MTDTERSMQQPCTHCGECAAVCPDRLDPEALFFALVDDRFGTAGAGRLDACRECNLCTEACPAHIPLLDWLRWGKAEADLRAQADARRDRYHARGARLAHARDARTAARREARSVTAAVPPVRTISRIDVLAAIARGRQHKARRRDT